VKSKAVIFLLGIIITLLIIYNNHLLFFFQDYRLKKHITALTPVYQTSGQSDKISFCNLQPYSKIWAHRVNTLERFLFLSDHFQGFEMDIVFDEQRNFFDIRHPPATSINLSFEKYLQAPESKGKFFWLDLKNLTNGNVGAILSSLRDLDNKYTIHQRIIIESNNILQLSKISDAGYFTSYYYDWDSYRDFMNNGNETFTEAVFKKIDAVSQDVLIYDTLLKRFPFKPKLTWALSIKNYLSDSMFNALDNDKGLLVYLVNVKSPQYR
jgi:hypothetical protein